MQSYLADKRIIHEKTTPYNLEQNRVAERYNRTLMESTRAMMHSAGILEKLWAELAKTVTYLCNRLPSRANARNTSLFELWFSTKPSINHLHVIWVDAF